VFPDVIDNTGVLPVVVPPTFICGFVLNMLVPFRVAFTIIGLVVTVDDGHPNDAPMITQGKGSVKSSMTELLLPIGSALLPAKINVSTKVSR
jgi:hypothetical protein